MLPYKLPSWHTPSGQCALVDDRMQIIFMPLHSVHSRGWLFVVHVVSPCIRYQTFQRCATI